MSWRDAAVLAMKNLRRRFGRSLLTVLAVALAATLLTALVTIAGTARTRVLKELAKGGPLAGIRVEAAEPDPAQIDNDNARPRRSARPVRRHPRGRRPGPSRQAPDQHSGRAPARSRIDRGGRDPGL